MDQKDKEQQEAVVDLTSKNEILEFENKKLEAAKRELEDMLAKANAALTENAQFVEKLASDHGQFHKEVSI